MYGDPRHYLMHIPELFRALSTSSFEAGAAERTVDGLGVALWLPPGIHGDDEPLEAVIAASMVREKQAESPPSSSKRNIIGQPSPIGIGRSSWSKLYIGTRGAWL